MTWYKIIRPTTEIFEIELDPNGRSQLVFNIRIEKKVSATLEEELISILEGASVGTFGEDMFCGKNVQIPAEGGPFLTIIVTTGPGPTYIHNDREPAIQRPNASITVRAPTLRAARTMADAAYAAFAVITNRPITP